jgi:copper transport protein
VLLAVILPPSAAARPRLWALVAGTAGGLALVSAAGIGLQGPSATGLGLASAFDWGLAREVLGIQFGKVWLARGLIALAIVPFAVAVSVRGLRSDRLVARCLLVPAAALVVTPALAGHARVEGTLAIVSDSVHVGSAAVWVGGLVFLLVALLWTSGGRWALAARTVPRYSAAALVAVAALITAGVINTILELDSISGLWTTTWGYLLLAKVTLVVVLLGLGAFNNRISVPRLKDEATTAVDRRRFVRAAVAEVALFAVVLGVTAVLVSEPPPKALAGTNQPVSVDSRVGPFDLQVVVDPARVGANQIHLYLLNRVTGQPAPVDEVDLAASLATPAIGPLKFKPVKAGPGHYVVSGASFPLPGAWELGLAVRRGDFDQWTQYIDFTIRKDTK